MNTNYSAHDQLLTARAVSMILAISEPAVRRLAAAGRLPSLRPLGLRVRRFRASDVLRIARGEAAAGESEKL
jgi:excisionase family DNA binding protein